MNEDVFITGYSTYAGQTTVHPLGLLAVVILSLFLLLLPRRWSVLPLLIMACFISSAQRIVIVGADFDFLRIMVLFGVIRLLLHREYLSFVWKSLDTAMVFWIISSVMFYIIRENTLSAVVNRMGFAFDAFGMYFMFRCLIQNWMDIDHIIRGIILISIPLAAMFLLENLTGRNLFSIFGGVPEITRVREGRLRCQGAYSHAILAGCFWASLIPLIAATWWKSVRARTLTIISLCCAIVIVFCCASSTPVMGILSALIGGICFYLRYRMRFVRWMILSFLIALHIVMKGPVWSLVARISAVGGSTGWHRYKLINQTINHFNDWWFCGCSGYTVAGWGIHAGDVTNQYILVGVTGGAATLSIFVIIIVVAYREVGNLWRSQVRNRYHLALAWSLGCSLFVHCINFIGVSYFGQILVVWYLLLAMICSMAPTLPLSKKTQSLYQSYKAT